VTRLLQSRTKFLITSGVFGTTPRNSASFPLDNSLISNYNTGMETNNIISLIASIRNKANQFIVSEMNQRGIKDLATSHGDILTTLFHNDLISMKEIADKIDRDKSTVTALVDKLINIGYVTKQKDSNDTRVILVSLTEKGKRLQSDFDDISQKLLNVVYLGIEESERERVIRTLIKIKDNF
jgi:DNA-binding MarR family transcriptional regulator